MTECSRCGHVNVESARYCARCGARCAGSHGKWVRIVVGIALVGLGAGAVIGLAAYLYADERDTPHANDVAVEYPLVAMQTSHGTIYLQLYPDQAPGTVANFLTYVDKGFYEGLVFHRIRRGRLIEGGGYALDWQPKTEGLEAPIANEADHGLTNRRGTIAMGRTVHPHSATAPFFINVSDNVSLDHRDRTPKGWGYCVFGEVIDGMDVVDAMAKLATHESRVVRGEESEPYIPPVIKKVERVSMEVD